MKYTAALRAYKTSPVVASVTSTPHVPLSGPAADSAASARSRKRSTSVRDADLLFAAAARELTDLGACDCAEEHGVPAQTTMPKTTHPIRRPPNFRCNAID